MPDSIPQEIEHGWELLNEGKEEDALKLMIEFEKVENLTPEESLRCQVLKGFLLFFLGKFEDALNVAEHAYQDSIKLKKSLLSIDVILIKWLTLIQLSRDKILRKDIDYYDKLLKSPLQEPHLNVEKREAFLNFMKGCFLQVDGSLDLAIKTLKKSFSICERYRQLSFLMPRVLMRMGATYYTKGELDKALKTNKKSLEYAKGNSIGIKIIRVWDFDCIGSIYYQQGELDQAIEYFEKAMKTIEQDFLIQAGCKVYDNLIKIFIDKNNSKPTKELLDRSQQYEQKVKGWINNAVFRLSKARILKASTRTRDRARAETILKGIIKDHIIEKRKLNFGGDFPLLGLPSIASASPYEITLCELYFEELKLTNDVAILEDIQPLVERLIKEAKQMNSYSLQAHAYLLQGKVSLLRMNLGDARLYITKAQQAAEPYGLQLLARKISSEHDNLLEQLDEWENLKNRKAPISERIDLASLDDTMDQMQGKREIDAPELINEDPLVLLIIAEGGVMMFSYPFTEDWKTNNDLFGNFLSAFTTFSNEFFSRELDRARFGEFTVLMKSVSNFIICYLFKGQAYQAQQKLSKFTEKLQENDPVREILDTYYNTGQVIETKDFPFLEVFIKEIFLS